MNNFSNVVKDNPSFFSAGEEGCLNVVVWSYYHDRYKTVMDGPGRLLTNLPESVRLGSTYKVRGCDDRVEERWETTSREVQLPEDGVLSGGFVAYVTNRKNSGCEYCGGPEIIPLMGDVPVLSYGTAYAGWAEAMEAEAYEYLSRYSEHAAESVRRSLRFAAGRVCGTAPHAQRRRAWVSVLRGLGATDDVGRIIGSVRTATVKAALRFGWKPSVAKPKFWEGLPGGVTEIAL